MAMTSVGIFHTCAGIPLLLSATKLRSGCCRVTPRPPSLCTQLLPHTPLPAAQTVSIHPMLTVSTGGETWPLTWCPGWSHLPAPVSTPSETGRPP